jgi:hypothetical protein
MPPSNEKINVIGQSKSIYVFYKPFFETSLYTSTYEGSNLLSHIFNAELHQIMSYHSAVILLALELLFDLETHIATVELMILEMYVH